MPNRLTASRRLVLKGGALATLAALYPRAAGAAPGLPTGTTIAFITDPHADPENGSQMARLSATLQAVASLEPDLVLHGGDVTEYGSPAEYQAYLDVIPPSLEGHILHVPGNHEVRWDVSAFEHYTTLLHAQQLSVEAGGIQVLLLDPTTVQQEVGYYTEEDLAWLTRELRSKPAHQPTIIVSHYPMGTGSYYIANQEGFLAAIEGRNVALLLVGHTHTQLVQRFNDLVQIEGYAVKNAAQFYLVTTADADEGQVMLVEHVLVPNLTDPTTVTRTPVAAIPLPGQTGRDPLDPRDVTVAADGDDVVVSVRLPASTPVTEVRAQLYNQGVWAGRSVGTWTTLTTVRPGLWEVRLDGSALPPGEHRVSVEVIAGVRTWREIPTFVKPGGSVQPAWELDLGGVLQGALARHDGLVFAASSAGNVVALDVSDRAPGEVWRTTVGPVYTALEVDAEQDLVLAGSADHHLYALRTADGSVVWGANLGAPVMADPRVASVDGRQVVMVMAGTALWVGDAANGQEIWQRDLGAISAGRVDTDGERIYLGLGDGSAWAFDAGTGEPLWSTPLSGQSSTYRKLIYGPWDSVVTALDNGLVLVSTVRAMHALDPVTGEVVWRASGSMIYFPPVVLEDGDIFSVDELGTARRIDADTGAVLWSAKTAPRVLNAGAAVVDGTAYVVGVGGLLTAVDLATGTVRQLHQLSIEDVLSTPVVSDGVLVVGHLDGVLRAFTL